MSFAKLMLSVISALFIGSLVAFGSLAFAQNDPNTQDTDPAQMSDTFKKYQKDLNSDLQNLQQDYLNQDFTKTIPKSVHKEAGMSDKEIAEKADELSESVNDAAEDLVNLRAQVASFEKQEKAFADLMTKGGVDVGYFTSLKSMARLCKEFDIKANKNFDPRAEIASQYDAAIKQMKSASDRLWNASNAMWNADQQAAGVLKDGNKDIRQQHVYQAQQAAYRAVQDLKNLRAAALSDYDSFVGNSKQTQENQVGENTTLQQRCADVQIRISTAAADLGVKKGAKTQLTDGQGQH